MPVQSAGDGQLPVISLCSAVCVAAGGTRDAGIGSACLEVIPTGKEGPSAPSEERVRRPCTWVSMMSLAKEGLARLNPQGCGMPWKADHGVISYTG